MYRFLASTVEEKEEWYSNLHRHILAQKQLFSKVCPTVLSVCPSIYLSIYLSIYPSIHPSSILPSTYLSIYLVCLSRSNCSFIYLQLLTHLSTPDEVYFCDHVKAKVNYLGMLKDGNYYYIINFLIIINNSTLCQTMEL